jgi:diguanylate cyclase (GGDEF)-like protein
VYVDTQLGLQERLYLLHRGALFGGLSAADLQPLARVATPMHFDPGETIVRQGDPSGTIYLIVHGRVQVRTAVLRDGLPTEALVSELGVGDTIGELSLLDGRPRSATCIALAETTCLCLMRDDFAGALRQHWSVADALLRLLADRLRAADARQAEQARDPLTSLYNRKAFADLYERECARAEGERGRGLAPAPAGVLFIDVDRFKDINDRYGHARGDDVLRAVARVLCHACRSTDIVARLGGDEFVILLPGAGVAGTQAAEQRLAALLRERHPGPVPFEISIGSALVDLTPGRSLVDLLDQADAAMYRQKAARRAS